MRSRRTNKLRKTHAWEQPSAARPRIKPAADPAPADFHQEAITAPEARDTTPPLTPGTARQRNKSNTQGRTQSPALQSAPSNTAGSPPAHTPPQSPP